MPAASRQPMPVLVTAPDKPRRLLTNSNRNLARDRIWTWTLPALAARLPDGHIIRTCPSAGVCAQVCYARAGAYMFPAVKAAHLRNLQYVVDDLSGWEAAMTKELTARRFDGAYVRIHDSGDFFSDAYTEAWLRIIASAPRTTFYAYTKEISRYERLIAPRAPENSRWILSFGGTEDSLIDPLRDRVADVFPDEDSIISLLNVRVDARREGSQSDELAGVLGTPGRGAKWHTAAVA